jgi:hypothetical protein
VASGVRSTGGRNLQEPFDLNFSEIRNFVAFRLLPFFSPRAPA